MNPLQEQGRPSAPASLDRLAPTRCAIRPEARQRPLQGEEIDVAASSWRLAPGRRTVNTEPLPASLDTVTSPPIMRASLRERARPSPVPPKFCAVEASA